MMQREEAYKLLKKHLKNKNLLKHCLTVEAVMGRLAEHFGEDKNAWSVAGLLHDIDYEKTKDNPEQHSLVGAEMLREEGLPEELIYAIKVHNDYHGLARSSKLDKALYATDPLTGLIVAAALIRPEKKLSIVDVEFLLNRFDENSFARGARRDVIASCEELDLTLEEFMALGLEAMKGISNELGL